MPDSGLTNAETSCNASSILFQQLQQHVTEKPTHYNYLKNYRVEQCALFLQHKCTQHRPYTCFYWHFKNQRRRRPVKRRDGSFNYNADVYCEKYDEQTGTCLNSDDCLYVHRNAGDTEKRYHMRYYKTTICIHETDAKGHCSRNGAHCALAHGLADLRAPTFDLKEMQTISLSSAQSIGADSFTSSQESSPSSNSEMSFNQNSADDIRCTNEKLAHLIGSLEKERILNEDPKWNDTNHVLINYKTEQCKRPPRLCRQGFACPQYHNARDRRRNPSIFKYRSTPCPQVKQGDDWLEPSVCDSGDSCKYCHSRTEQQFHPEIYKSSKCNDMIATGYCPRGPFCAFAHIEAELKNHSQQQRTLSDDSDYNLESFIHPTPAANRSIGIGSNKEDTEEEAEEEEITATNELLACIAAAQQQQMQVLLEASLAAAAATSFPKPIGSERDNTSTSPKQISSPTSKSGVPVSSPNRKFVTAALPSSSSSPVFLDSEKERLIGDLRKQSEMCNKLEALCMQYKQWVEKLTSDVNEWKVKYLRSEKERSCLELQLFSNLNLSSNSGSSSIVNKSGGNASSNDN